VGHGAHVAGPGPAGELAQKVLPLIGIEDRADVEEPHLGATLDEAIERGEGQERLLDHPNAGWKDEEHALGGQGPPRGEVERVRARKHRGLRDGHQPGGHLGQRPCDASPQGVVEDDDSGRPFEDAAYGCRALGIGEVVIGIGAGDGDDQWDLVAPGQAERERPHTVGVKRVDNAGTERLDFPLDHRLRGDRQVPHPKVGTGLAEPAGNALHGHGVAPDRRKRKWRHHRDPERHCGQGYRAQRPTVQASLQRIGGPNSGIL